MGSALVPHFAFPFTLDMDGTFTVVEQDAIGEVAQCVAVLVLSRPGDRPDLPSYGVTAPELTAPALGWYDAPALVAAAARYEPRASLAVNAGRGADDLAASVQVAVAQAKPST